MNYHFKCETKKPCRNFTKVVHFSSKKFLKHFFKKKNFETETFLINRSTGSLSEEIEIDFLFFFKMENKCEIETYLITLVIICRIGAMFNTRSVMGPLNLKNISIKLDDLILNDCTRA